MTQDELDLHIARATAELRLQVHVLDQRVNMLNRDRNGLMQELASRNSRGGDTGALAAVIRHLQSLHNPLPIPPLDLATAVVRWIACGCTECYGTGSRDSGGQTPWGEPIWLAYRRQQPNVYCRTVESVYCLFTCIRKSPMNIDYKQYEDAARRLCALRKLDPDRRVAAEPEAVNGFVADVMLLEPQWQTLVPELVAHHDHSRPSQATINRHVASTSRSYLSRVAIRKSDRNQDQRGCRTSCHACDF